MISYIELANATDRQLTIHIIERIDSMSEDIDQLRNTIKAEVAEAIRGAVDRMQTAVDNANNKADQATALAQSTAAELEAERTRSAELGAAFDAYKHEVADLTDAVAAPGDFGTEEAAPAPEPAADPQPAGDAVPDPAEPAPGSEPAAPQQDAPADNTGTVI